MPGRVSLSSHLTVIDQVQMTESWIAVNLRNPRSTRASSAVSNRLRPLWSFSDDTLPVRHMTAEGGLGDGYDLDGFAEVIFDIGHRLSFA